MMRNTEGCSAAELEEVRHNGATPAQVAEHLADEALDAQRHDIEGEVISNCEAGAERDWTEFVNDAEVVQLLGDIGEVVGETHAAEVAVRNLSAGDEAIERLARVKALLLPHFKRYARAVARAELSGDRP